jgi:acetamidase/formamidase
MTCAAVAVVVMALYFAAADALAESGIAVASETAGKVHLLPATLETTQWGWFDNSQPPVLTIDSGDTVILETMTGAHNQIVPGRTLDEILKLRADNPGRGPHTVTGPIFVRGAEPGDTLKVRINRIVPRAYAINYNLPGQSGQFPNDYPVGQIKYVYLDTERKVAEFLPGIYIPLAPFPGTVAVARKEPGRFTTVPPGEYAGNMDIRDLTAGTTLYIPVFVQGALLWTGDSHAAQGNGEVNLTALETAFKEFNITVSVLKNMRIDFPRIETPTSWITMGMDVDLNVAWEGATQQTIKLLAEQYRISTVDAAAMMPTISDCRISQVVNIKKGVHCLSPKNTAHREDLERPTKETAAYYVTHAAAPDLNKAMDGASMAMLKWLESHKGIARLDAYALASAAMDCRIGAISAAEKNVHCLMPKSLWQAPH